MKVKNIRHLMLGIICLVLAVICLAVGAAGGSAPKYLISAVLLLALGAVNFHGALKGGAEQELLRWTDERDRLVAAGGKSDRIMSMKDKAPFYKRGLP